MKKCSFFYKAVLDGCVRAVIFRVLLDISMSVYAVDTTLKLKLLLIFGGALLTAGILFLMLHKVASKEMVWFCLISFLVAVLTFVVFLYIPVHFIPIVTINSGYGLILMFESFMFILCSFAMRLLVILLKIVFAHISTGDG